MARKQNRVTGRMLFTWFVLAGFIFLFAPQNLTNKFQLAFTHIFRWPLNIGRSISLFAHTQQPITDTAVVSRREYNKLQNHLANLTEQLYQEHQKVEILSGLRDRLPLKAAKLVLADIIREFMDGLHSEFTINRGENDGLTKGQFVLGDNSIIGTISYVFSHTAQVKLVTDSTSKIAVKIAKLNRVMQGSGNNSAKVQLLSIKHKVKIGDVVYAGKKPGFLDVPMIIGTVAQCKRDDENPSLWDITVKPACDIKKLNSVAVIIMNPPK